MTEILVAVAVEVEVIDEVEKQSECNKYGVRGRLCGISVLIFSADKIQSSDSKTEGDGNRQAAGDKHTTS